MFKIAWSPIYAHPLPPEHRFPMEKYTLLPQQLKLEGLATEADFFAPLLATDAQVLAVHSVDYIHRLKNLELTQSEIRASGFPLSQSLVERELCITGGTIQCVDFALRDGIAGNIAGGTHHAFRDRGEGFCLLNDAAVAAQYALDSGKANKILIVDLDVHQGNGTAAIFEGEERVFTFSMHGGKNYPMHKEKSDLDVALPDGIEDSAYLTILRSKLDEIFGYFTPDLVFYQAGVDVLASDKLGRLALTLDGCRNRDKTIFGWMKARNLPVVFNMGGSYSPDIKTIIKAHTNTFRMARDAYF